MRRRLYDGYGYISLVVIVLFCTGFVIRPLSSASGPTEAAQDSVCTSGSSGTSLSIASFDSNCTSCALVIGLHTRANVSNHSCTFNGVAINDATDNAAQAGAEIYLAAEPITTASATVSCSWTTTAEACMTVRSYNDVGSLGPTTNATGLSLQSSCTLSSGVSSGDLVVDVTTRFSATANPMTVGTGQTEDFNLVTNNASNNARAVASSEVSAGSSVTMTWDWTLTNREWASACIVLQQ